MAGISYNLSVMVVDDNGDLQFQGKRPFWEKIAIIKKLNDAGGELWLAVETPPPRCPKFMEVIIYSATFPLQNNRLSGHLRRLAKSVLRENPDLTGQLVIDHKNSAISTLCFLKIERFDYLGVAYLENNRIVLPEIHRLLHQALQIFKNHFDNSSYFILEKEHIRYLPDGSLSLDLKPENIVEVIMQRTAGYGVSRGLFHAPELMTTTGLNILDPEKVMVFSYGVLLKCLFTGSWDLTSKLTYGRTSGLPRALAEIHQKCTCERPTDRPHFRDIADIPYFSGQQG